MKAIVEAYREAGKLGEFKERSARRLGSIIELAEGRLIQKLEEDKVPANVLPIVLGVAHDKKGQLEAGFVPGTGRTVEEVSLDRYAAYLEAVRLRVKAATEAQSDARGAFAAHSGPVMDVETRQETPAAPLAPSQAGVPPAAAAAPATSAPEGGGGDLPPPPGANGPWVPSEILEEQKDVPNGPS